MHDVKHAGGMVDPVPSRSDIRRESKQWLKTMYEKIDDNHNKETQSQCSATRHVPRHFTNRWMWQLMQQDRKTHVCFVKRITVTQDVEKVEVLWWIIRVHS
jgi:hypothetical protein